MAKRFNGRCGRDYRVFLEAHGFSCVNGNGDDDIYERQGYGYTVKIPHRDSEEVPTGTALQIVRCIEKCGISRKDVLKWWKDNGHGE